MNEWDNVSASVCDSVKIGVSVSVLGSARGVWGAVIDSVSGSFWASVGGNVWDALRDKP